ncbi:MAG: hypothetical protein E7623_03955 [Ruminococcaceae bacterium]|nr:hypothetical protein [Oscillospiraceae bacterium]
MLKSKKKRLILIFFAFAVLFICISLPFLRENTQKNKETPNNLPSYIFYEPDYDTDILSDPEYLKLNRIILYTNGALSITVSPEDYESTDKVLYFLAEFTDTMIEGDFTKYPSFFSEKYNIKNTLPEKFTMQRIYDVSIEKIDQYYAEEDGVEHEQYIYKLDYLIDKNDGTLRRDIGSGESIPQYLVITERNGRLEIDDVLTYTYKN